MGKGIGRARNLYHDKCENSKLYKLVEVNLSIALEGKTEFRAFAE
jgi:hypothetical protein